MRNPDVMAAPASAVLVLAAVAALPLGCAGAPEQRVVLHPDGTPARRGLVVDGMQQGEWEFFYPDGQLEARGSYRDDRRDGFWQHWHENGQPRMAGRYEGDRQSGAWEFWHDNGRLQCRGEYRRGLEHGEWSFFRADGRLQQRGCFADGRRALWWTELGVDGAVTAAGCYLDDQPIGEWTVAGPDGQPRAVHYALPSDCRYVRETWDDGSVRREGFVRDGKPAGLWVTRHRGGSLRLIGPFTGGRPAGEFAAYAGSGQLLARGAVVDGRLQGPWHVRDARGERTIDLGGRPRMPWDGQWADAAIAEREDALQVAERWLAEMESPLAAIPVSPPAPAAPPAAQPPAAPTERLEAPTDPGPWTLRELADLPRIVRWLTDGFVPRRAGAGGYFAASRDELGVGDAARAAQLLGRRLPVTRFRSANGEPFDLDSLRGRRVLLVVLRGFTAQVCVYCFAQTAALVPFTPRLAELQCELVVMFPGSRSRFQAFKAACADEFAETRAPWHMVYDPDLSLGVALGIEGNLVRPASLILDRDGVVRHAYVAESERHDADRPAAARLVELVADLAARGTR
jgi:antitoxin component YwqK of YwqJK toxin-antitoxin module/peroxiredoxin